MRYFSIAMVGAAVAFSQIALAADMPVKAPRYAPTPALYSWTGFYIGGNVGYSWGNADTDFNAAPVTVATTAGPFTIPGFIGTEAVKPTGFIGGGQIGYNWQLVQNWVAGVEADIQGSGEKTRNSFDVASTYVNPFGGPLGTAVATTAYEAKISWFGTVRGRLGYS